MGIVRFLVAVFALPFAAALVLLVRDVFRAMAVSDGGMSSVLLAAGCGFMAFLAIWITVPQKPVRLYVLGHELTHAVWGLLFGARVSNLKVSLNGGSVMLTKSNVLITLAPYFFPFYTMLVALVAAITRIFVSPLPLPWLWIFAVGFTWCFHVCFTLRSLAQRQPDVVEYGHLFSWVFIWAFNVLGIVVWMLATTEVPAALAWNSLCEHVCAAYVAVWRFFLYCWSILPFNR